MRDIYKGIIALIALSVQSIALQDLVLHHDEITFEPVHEISDNVVCATSKASDQPAHMRSLIRAFASRLSILRLLSY